LEQARREAERLVEESLIVQQAEQRAREILQEAQQDAETRRRETDEYVRNVLNRLERFARRLLEIVEEGRQELENR
jgi:vacuolar-type H+-ATPase subunit H